MAAVEKATGIVLDVRQVRESSLEVTFYTEEFGKFRGLLKGSRLSSAKFGSPALPATLNSIVFYPGRGQEPYLITQCDLIEGYDGIRRSMKKVAYAAYFLELTEEMNFPRDRNRQMFRLLVHALDYLERKSDVEKAARAFEVQLVKYAGLMPRLNACVFCGEKLKGHGSFSPLLGGVLCRGCIGKDRHAFPVSAGALKSIGELSRLRFDNLERLGLIKTIPAELKVLLKRFLEFHLEKRLNSTRFIEKLQII